MSNIRIASAGDLISSLSGRIHEVLQPLLPRKSVCALFNFPNHSNPGDSASWLGARAYLRKIAARVVYTCELATYSEEQLRAKLNGGTILLHGGGNLGDLYPNLQRRRENVIEAFPDRKIIQLPQAIDFREKTNLSRARDVFDRHPDLTLLVRDQRSLEFARNEFRAPSFLCPDMAFALGALDWHKSPKCPIVWLSRSDKEASGYAVPNGADDLVERTDWLEETALRDRASSVLITHFSRRAQSQPRLSALVLRAYDFLARQRLIRACRLLTRGRVVLTDRLHGHILSLLLGLPHVLMDDRYGKAKAFYTTWTMGCELTHWSDSPAEGLEKARSIAREFVIS